MSICSFFSFLLVVSHVENYSFLISVSSWLYSYEPDLPLPLFNISSDEQSAVRTSSSGLNVFLPPLRRWFSSESSVTLTPLHRGSRWRRSGSQNHSLNFGNYLTHLVKSPQDETLKTSEQTNQQSFVIGGFSSFSSCLLLFNIWIYVLIIFCFICISFIIVFFSSLFHFISSLCPLPLFFPSPPVYLLLHLHHHFPSLPSSLSPQGWGLGPAHPQGEPPRQVSGAGGHPEAGVRGRLQGGTAPLPWRQ